MNLSATGFAPAAVSDGSEPSTILVVDDEPAVRLLITEILADLGYRALDAANGAAGLDLLRSDCPIRLLVADVGLPGGMDGNQLAQAARAVRPGLPVLIITGSAEDAANGARPLGPGMMLLPKPFTFDDLAARIQDLLAGS